MQKKSTTGTCDRDKIFDFLCSHCVGTLGTVGPDCMPHVSVIYFSVDKELGVMFTTKRRTVKHANITHNNRVMLIAYEAFSQTTVQISGTAKEVKNIKQAGAIFRNTLKSSMKTSGIGIPPISKMYAGEYVAYVIKPDHISMTVFSRANPSNYEIYDTADREITVS